MPSDIKKAVIALVISCISTLIAVYFDGLEYDGISFNDPFTLGINIVWTLVIAWIIWDLIKGKDIKLTLILVGAIMLAALLYDWYEFGFSTAHIFYAIELLMFGFAYYLVKTKQSRVWYSEND